MAPVTLVLVMLFSGAHSAVLRDVPLGECHGCEVTCFEDCSLKYDREILQDDFLQINAKPENQTKVMTKERIASLSSQYVDCLKGDKCPCPKEEAKAKAAAPASLPNSLGHSRRLREGCHEPRSVSQVLPG